MSPAEPKIEILQPPPPAPVFVVTLTEVQANMIRKAIGPINGPDAKNKHRMTDDEWDQTFPVYTALGEALGKAVGEP